MHLVRSITRNILALIAARSVSCGLPVMLFRGLCVCVGRGREPCKTAELIEMLY